MVDGNIEIVDCWMLFVSGVGRVEDGGRKGREGEKKQVIIYFLMKKKKRTDQGGLTKRGLSCHGYKGSL